MVDGFLISVNVQLQASTQAHTNINPPLHTLPNQPTISAKTELELNTILAKIHSKSRSTSPTRNLPKTIKTAQKWGGVLKRATSFPGFCFDL